MVSHSMCFGRGEGLPGRGWDEGRPIVLRELDPAVVRRSEPARAEGLTCAIALPIFAGDTLKAVLVMFCGDDDEHAGAIELWRNDPAESKDMTLDDGYYGTTADAFEFISRRTSFRKGVGLPHANVRDPVHARDRVLHRRELAVVAIARDQPRCDRDHDRGRSEVADLTLHCVAPSSRSRLRCVIG